MTFDEIWRFLPAAGASLAVFAASWILGILAYRVISQVGNTRHVDPDVMQVLAQSAKIGLLLLGGISALGTLGVNVAAMVAGLGLTGLALGLAMKEIVSNALSGMMILAYKPFKRKDQITVLTFQGTVCEVNLRFTVLDTGTSKVFVPNTILLTNAVIVNAAPNGLPNGAGKGDGVKE